MADSDAPRTIDVEQPRAIEAGRPARASAGTMFVSLFGVCRGTGGRGVRRLKAQAGADGSSREAAVAPASRS